jgi:hypothetical protein
MGPKEDAEEDGEADFVEVVWEASEFRPLTKLLIAAYRAFPLGSLCTVGTEFSS